MQGSDCILHSDLRARAASGDRGTRNAALAREVAAVGMGHRHPHSKPWSNTMKHSAALKMMGLAGALVSLGVFAADDSRTKDMNKGKADASFVEQAAMSNVTEIKVS